MITLTPAAAKQIKKSAVAGRMEGLPLRVAVMRTKEDNFHYGMGFDDANLEDDMRFKSEGVEIVTSGATLAMLNGMTVDYVELDEGQYKFIFLNPNEPSYKPPREA